MSNIVLYYDKKDCCGCAACMNACPQTAIQMKPDENGFLYPVIDKFKCIECGACISSCGYNDVTNFEVPHRTFAAYANDQNLLKQVASGGVFAVIAQNVINRGGVVYGATMGSNDGKMQVCHCKAETIEDLQPMYGSKYVQSDIGFTYRDVKNNLLNGKNVLFSGTPCQVAGLKHYLKKDYYNLLTAEIICHGVPSNIFFQQFIQYTEDKYKADIEKFSFRDKTKGQGMMACMSICLHNGVRKQIVKNGNMISFFSFFLKGLIYRENCYSCPYAIDRRGADITMGDFWGFHEEYPQLNSKCGFSNSKGVSCLLINTEKGENFVEHYSDGLNLMISDFDKVATHNEQLIRPSRENNKREKIFEIYRELGYDGVEEYYKKNFILDRAKVAILAIIPKSLRRSLSRIKGILK